MLPAAVVVMFDVRFALGNAIALPMVRLLVALDLGLAVNGAAFFCHDRPSPKHENAGIATKSSTASGTPTRLKYGRL